MDKPAAFTQRLSEPCTAKLLLCTPLTADAEQRPSPTFIRRGSLAGKAALTALATRTATAARQAANRAAAAPPLQPTSQCTDV